MHRSKHRIRPRAGHFRGRLGLFRALVGLVLFAASSPANAQPDERAPLARWQLTADRLTGTTFKALAGPLDAHVVGPVRFSKDAPRALMLDGNAKAGHRVAVLDDSTKAKLPADAITVEAWVLLDKAPRWGGFVGALQDNGDYERGWLLGNAGAHFCFALATAHANRLTYLQAPQALETGYWYHVVGTYDGTAQRLYVDGRLAARSDAQRGPILYAPKGPLTIGAYQDDNELHTLAGRLESVSVWGRALSPAEVRGLFDARKGRFPDVEPPPAPAVPDWPTYLHDNLRTGSTPAGLAFPLGLQWVHRSQHAPHPAWPPPAKDDFWHRKRDLAPRVIYDRAFHPVAVGDDVFFGSSADDKVVCLDARTGRVRWSFFAEGPIRLAPTVAEGKVLFGSDDGRVYCLSARDGELLWAHRAGGDRRIPGNERMISLFPVRTGVLADGGVAHFCAGLFPVQGLYQVAVDAGTGRAISSTPVDAPVQGYMQLRNGQLSAATGRDPKGAVLSPAQRRGKAPASPLPAEQYPYALIEAADAAVGGGDGKVAAFHTKDGRQLWAAEVEGRAYALAAAGGRLLVGTDAGHIYCFAPGGAPAAAADPPTPAPPAADRRCAEAAEHVVKAAGLRRGWCLVIGSGDGGLLAELARRTEWRIVGVEPDEKLAAASRRALDAAGLYGPRVAVHRVKPTELPYADSLFNVVVAGRLDGGSPALRREALRVLVPGRGVAVLGTRPRDVLRRDPPAGGGQWTHTWGDPGNTACSSDRLVGGQMRLQWFGRPGPREMIDRHHRNTPPLAKDGRLFVPGDDVLFAVDAFNGAPLWQASLPGSRRLGVFLDCGSMALDEELLYWVAAEKCHGFDVRTGERRLTHAMPQCMPGQKRLWGYVARAGELIVGSGRKENATYTEVSRDADSALWYDNMQLVLSDCLFALDRRTGRPRWTYRAGAILNTTLALGGGRVYFVETDAAKALADPLGRVAMPTFLDGETRLVALDLATGQVAWRRKTDLSNCRLIAYLSYAGGKLVLSGCRYEDQRLWYWVYGIDAARGEAVWQRAHATGSKPGGDHGEQNRHPTIVGETVYAFPLAYNLHTGEPVEGWKFDRRGHGCGNLSASAHCLFWRGTNPWMWDLRPGGGPAPLNRVSRPGCFINILPACGLVLVPEASSGCSCNHPIQTSMGFAPASERPELPAER